MASEDTTSFPSLGARSLFALRKKFKQTIPASVSTSYLATVLGMSEHAARNNVMPGLRSIGLIDNENRVNAERAQQFRDDELYSEFCKNVLSESYPQELLELFPEVPEDKTAVRNWFMRRNKIGENAASKLAATFTTFLEATPHDVEAKVRKPAAGAKTASSPKKGAAGAASESAHSTTTPPVKDDNRPPRFDGLKVPELNINVQIHISAEASSAQIEQIFESMGKHLFKS